MVRRLARSTLAVAIVVAVLVMPALVLGSTPGVAPSAKDAGTNGCPGIANAYAHVSANVERNGNNGNALTSLAGVAAKLGCDLTAPAPAPGNEPETDNPTGTDNASDEDNETDPNDDTSADQPGPPAQQQAKCDKIATKLQAAQAKPHGKSADAFARQADRWGCPAS
jgi:hypothetical protein